MRVIKPEKKAVYNRMKTEGCIWCGGHGCECHYRINFKECFESAEKRMTEVVYTAEEEQELIEKGNRAAAEFDEMMNELFDYK